MPRGLAGGLVPGSPPLDPALWRAYLGAMSDSAVAHVTAASTDEELVTYCFAKGDELAGRMPKHTEALRALGERLRSLGGRLAIREHKPVAQPDEAVTDSPAPSRRRARAK